MSLLDVFRHETAKQRALRIPLDYAYQLHWVGQWKAVLAVCATVVAMAYCVWVGLTPEGQQSQLNPGKLAGVHSAWERDCQACHIPGVPLRGDADGTQWVNDTLAYFKLRDKVDPHASDEKCTTCHAGPRHHFRQADPSVETCAACHRDHKGESADINRPDDQVCTRCHRDIQKHILEGKDPPPNSIARSEMSKNVTVFAKDAHPEFYTLTQKDPGNIRFSHQLHLLPGQALADTPEKMKKRLEDLPEALRSLYKADDKGYVQLDCNSCHGLETPSGSGGAVPSAGTYMQPIVFEKHCQACHPLNVAPTNMSQVPHGIQGKELLGAIAALMQGTELDPPLSPSNPRKIPGQPMTAASEAAKPDTSAQAQYNRLRAENCALCHGPAASEEKDVESIAQNDILPANLQAVWFKNARFSHAAHRAAKCEECHAGAAKKPEGSAAKQSLLDHDEILIPNMDNCLGCHAPGLARHDCAECHRYHDIDQPPLGLGGIDRGVTKRLDRNEFLRPYAAPPRSPPSKEGS